MPLPVVPERYSKAEAEQQAAAEGLELNSLGHTRGRGRDGVKCIWRRGPGQAAPDTLYGYRLSVPDDDAFAGQGSRAQAGALRRQRLRLQGSLLDQPGGGSARRGG